ncbi:MAG: FHA domain-containing protein [Gammaproteobacteria bacterium]
MSKLALSFKGQSLKLFSIRRGSLFIGSDPACEIHIDSLAINARHARLDTEDQVTVLHNLATAEGEGLLVNQQKVEQHTLKDGDVIQIGKHTLTYKYEPIQDEDLEVSQYSSATLEMPDTRSQEALRPGWLQIMTGQNLGKTLSLNRSMTNLGKPGVATALITRRNDGYFISHLEGKQPPLVGNQPIGAKNHKLNDGDTIQIGNVKMQFYLE